MSRITVRLVAAAVLAALAAGVSGCQNEQNTSAQPTEPQREVAWSTKKQWAREPDPGMAHLNVPEPMLDSQRENLRAIAFDVLDAAASSTNPMLRANAIEAMSQAPERLDPVLYSALHDSNRGVRFVAAMSVGQLRLGQYAADVRPLLADDSPSVQAAAIYALRRCGEPVDLSPLGSMIISPQPEVKGNAALVFGLLGDSAALPVLRDALRRNSTRTPSIAFRKVDLQIAEAMVKLGQEGEIEVIRAALLAPYEEGELTVLACQMLGELHDGAYLAALRDKAVRQGREQEPAEIRIASASAAARIDPYRAPLPVMMSYVGHEQYTIRAQVAWGLGYFEDVSVVPTLSTMVRDPNALVQVSAAGALLRITESDGSVSAE